MWNVCACTCVFVCLREREREREREMKKGKGDFGTGDDRDPFRFKEVIRGDDKLSGFIYECVTRALSGHPKHDFAFFVLVCRDEV